MTIEYFKNKRILVTGCCGTVGSELIKQLMSLQGNGPENVLGVDINETSLFFQDQEYLEDDRAAFVLGDVTSITDVSRLMAGSDIVFHSAAYKHVIMTERSPDHAVRTNIIGTQNVIKAALANGVSKVIFTSSDKAVNPTSVMGTSKLMGERLMTAANSSRKSINTIFASTRFGNVLGSSGSVVPIFHNQIRKGGPVTITDEGMTRFVMSVQQAVALVLRSAIMACGGEVFVTKMPVVNIQDLAEVMIKELAPRYGYAPNNIKQEVIGIKPGEKIYEELMSDEEIRRALELQRYFSILPAFKGIYGQIDYHYIDEISRSIDRPYRSSTEPTLAKNEIAALLENYNLLEQPEFEDTRRYWPGDKERS